VHSLILATAGAVAAPVAAAKTVHVFKGMYVNPGYKPSKGKHKGKSKGKSGSTKSPVKGFFIVPKN
jgi:hypothetical protein